MENTKGENTMYRIELDGQPLCHYGEGRYGWGRIDSLNGNENGLPVEFINRGTAYDWQLGNRQMTRGSFIVEAPTIPTNVSAAPKKRGRPATGNALTAAERKRAQRERDRKTAELIGEAPNKVPPRVIAETISSGSDFIAFTAWLELGERNGWITSAQRISLRNAQLDKS